MKKKKLQKETEQKKTYIPRWLFILVNIHSIRSTAECIVSSEQGSFRIYMDFI